MNVASVGSTANSGNWRLVASESNKNVYVCGYTLVAAGPLTVKFVAGRGSNAGFSAGACGASSRDLTGAMSIAASGGIANAVAIRPIIRTEHSEQMCINLSDGKQVSGHFTYTQF